MISCNKSDNDSPKKNVSTVTFDPNSKIYYPDLHLGEDDYINSFFVQNDKLFLNNKKVYKCVGKNINYEGLLSFGNGTYSNFGHGYPYINDNSFIYEYKIYNFDYSSRKISNEINLQNLIPNGTIKNHELRRSYSTLGSNFAILPFYMDKANSYGEYCGSVCLFKKESNNWKFVKRINGDNDHNYAFFGAWIFIKEDYVLISAPGTEYSRYGSGDIDFDNAEGAVFLYKYNDGDLELIKRFERSYDPKVDQIFDGFGASACLSDKFVIITDNVFDAIEIYDLNSGSLYKRIESSSSISEFGTKCHIDDQYLYVNSKDEVYVFDIAADFRHIRTLAPENKDSRLGFGFIRTGDWMASTDNLIIIASPFFHDDGTVLVYYK